MGREIKRVPLDFAWPLEEVWSGFIMPEELCLEPCRGCKGSGASPAAIAIDMAFYAHAVGDRAEREAMAWRNKIGQLEVDNLVATGRIPVGATAEQVNAANSRGGSMLGSLHHDSINRWSLVKFRCERLGIEAYCKLCNGSGQAGTDEQRAANDAWERSEPPTGDGWQVWETVSEGSPISQVFQTREEMVEWLVAEGYSRGSAESFSRSGYAPSMLIAGGEILSDIEACSRMNPK